MKQPSLFANFYRQIAGNRLAPWLQHLPAPLADWQTKALNGRFGQQLRLLEHLPSVTEPSIKLDTEVRIGSADSLDEAGRERLYKLLQKLSPWRKGPYFLHGLQIDTEWRSDWKWERLQPHISPLQGRYVLDVGCGSGYHLWRMRGAGAECVVGIDPYELFLAQFLAIQHYIRDEQVHFLPLGSDELPTLPLFDTVFAMGVLYHRRSPLDFLRQMRDCLTPDGELVLETLVIAGDERTVLMPESRYARMNNVWFIPSAQALMLWLRRTGFKDVKLVDLNQTSVSEQRKTDWIEGESLAECLEPENPDLTIEGYPAPLRAIILARQ